MSVEILVLSGDEVESYLGSVARLRMEIFAEFPYLYDGDLDYEREYLKKYAGSEHCVFVLAVDDGEVVGAATGVRMDEADPEFQLPFEGQDLTDIFYFGESVLKPEYRGEGIGHRFFEEREKFAAGLGCTICTFCAVERPEEHPKRPDDFRPLDPFWHKRGYVRLDHLRTEYAWTDLGEEEETPKVMVFWIRPLGG